MASKDPESISDFVLEVDIRTMSDKAINHCLQHFMLEARKK